MNDNDAGRGAPPSAAEPKLASKGTCPQCGRPVQLVYRPFCSKRCSDLDLSRWLNGVYAVPGRSTEEEADEEE
jgi:uncharacterized protein